MGCRLKGEEFCHGTHVKNSAIGRFMQLNEYLFVSVSGRISTPLVKAEEMNEAKGRIKELEKDLFYYRKTSKDLKNKLREVVGVNHRLAGVLREKGWVVES